MRNLSIYLVIMSVLISCGSGNEESPCGKIPPGNEEVMARIIEVKANPTGPDEYNESFTIKNFSDSDIDFSGWWVENSGGKVWELKNLGILEPCKQKTIVSVQSDALDNKRDSLKLIDSDNRLVQVVTWEDIIDGENVYP